MSEFEQYTNADKETMDMNITFMIGNGFDLNLGLKTKYTDFYPYFMKNASDDNMIKLWIKDSDIELWSDLESRLGLELYKIKSEEDIQKFYDDKDELDRLLLEYLEMEQDRYFIEEKDKKEVMRSMLEFYKNLSEENKDSIRKTLEIYARENYMYKYITFNYTNLVDRFIGEFSSGERVIASHPPISSENIISTVHHVHGTVDSGMILGVNDSSQINNEMLNDDEMFLNTFIKQNMNKSIGYKRTDVAFNIIDKSAIICVFGMSIGETDKIYWEKLVSWLRGDSYNKLIIYKLEETSALDRMLPSKIIRLDDSIRRLVFERGKGQYGDEVYNEIKDRIMISYNDSIFSFSKLVD